MHAVLSSEYAAQAPTILNAFREKLTGVVIRRPVSSAYYAARREVPGTWSTTVASRNITGHLVALREDEGETDPTERLTEAEDVYRDGATRPAATTGGGAFRSSAS